MPSSKADALAKVATLVAKYQALSPAQRRGYKEENTKKDFILPLFQALGWDVYNQQSQEVLAEVQASKGRVDYAFKIRGVSRFFLEAKPLETSLVEAKSVNQAVGYALNRGVTWAALTNFKELHLFYALADKPDPHRWKMLRCTDYLPRLDDLWLLSRESFESGHTDEQARLDGALPPKLLIEERLFRQLRDWRERLTNDLLRYHDELTGAQVDEVVERLFNRLIFIRNCEDQAIENPTLWPAWQDWDSGRTKGTLLAAVRGIFRQFADWYDSDLFPETPHLLDQRDKVHIDDDLLGVIIRGLYRVEGGYADYDFSAIDADVLGRVYEQYLGHVAQVARVRAEQKVRQMTLAGIEPPRMEVVEKRAKRKQQGIYYTPKWVVDYIVRETVGRTLDEAGAAKGAAQERLHSIRILDPACGSGSFLIRAYDELLEREASLSGRSKSAVFDERWLMLQNNIFGVDLDPQAADIARLNLMLRALVRRDKLPLLQDNIQRGNSLISGGKVELEPYFKDTWEAKRPFNWAERFPQVMAEGGFDVVIGNPPYVFGEHLLEADKKFYRKNYRVASGQYDSYWLFMEKSLSLLRDGGYHGFIVPDAILVRDEAAVLRECIMRQGEIVSFAHVGPVFQDSAVSCVIVVVRKAGHPRANHRVAIHDVAGETSVPVKPKGRIPQRDFLKHPKHAFVLESQPDWRRLSSKIGANCQPLGSLVTISRGEEFGKKNLEVFHGRPGAGRLPILVGEDIRRYEITTPRHAIARSVVGKPPATYASPKLVLVKTGGSLIASLEADHRVTLQSVYNLHKKADAPYHLNVID